MWSVSHVICIDIIAQVSLTRWSIFLFSDVSTLKLRIIIIILQTDQSDIILRLTLQQIIKLPSRKSRTIKLFTKKEKIMRMKKTITCACHVKYERVWYLAIAVKERHKEVLIQISIIVWMTHVSAVAAEYVE